ncbi:MAG: hypothetical protein ABI068_10940, partial [Ktedonobacterales bacterium]
MLVCHQCGRTDVPGTLFCQNCGASLEPGEPGSATDPTADAGQDAGAQRGRSADGYAHSFTSAYATPPFSGGLVAVNSSQVAGNVAVDWANATPQQARQPARQTLRATAPDPAAPIALNAPPYELPAVVELRLPNGHIFVLSGKTEYRI